MATSIRVHVFVDAASQARVFPGLDFAGEGDTIEFTNSTTDDIFISFPDGVLEDQPGPGGPVKQNHKVLAGNNPKVKHTPKVKVNSNRGSQKYNVFCSQTGTLAIGNSQPEIIIE
jgi:hypothetical protein